MFWSLTGLISFVGSGSSCLFENSSAYTWLTATSLAGRLVSCRPSSAAGRQVMSLGSAVFLTEASQLALILGCWLPSVEEPLGCYAAQDLRLDFVRWCVRGPESLRIASHLALISQMSCVV